METLFLVIEKAYILFSIEAKQDDIPTNRELRSRFYHTSPTLVVSIIFDTALLTGMR